MSDIEVAIVGAGPYGLAVAAHLRARGVPFRIFGEPMSSWLNMPKGMFLKSLGFATSISVPGRGLDFPTYLAARNLETFEPCSTKDFAEYGLWIQSLVAPEVERVMVTNISATEPGYELTLATGARVRAQRVLVAVGLGPHSRLPRELAGLPPELVTHTFGQPEFSRLAGKDVAVVGAGSSALEAATLMHEEGVNVRLILRKPAPTFHTKLEKHRTVAERLRAPLSQMGPSQRSWIIEQLGGAMWFVPEERRVRMAREYLGPSGSWWLHDRFEGRVPVHGNTTIASASVDGSKAVLRLLEKGKPQREARFDHVVCGTGFEHDLDKISILDPALLSRLARTQKAPRLSRQFESSMPGLYIVGPISAYSFGPFFRFVCGTEYTAKTASRHIAAQGGLVKSFVRRATAPPALVNR